jgi:mannan endo-1,4-beta-mannosidase
LTHVNPYTGLTYAEDPTIFAYETGNELSGAAFDDQAVPVAWTTEIAEFVKSLAPHKLIVDGMDGLNATNPPIAAVDIVSNHFYPLNLAKLESDLALAEKKGKAYLAGE